MPPGLFRLNLRFVEMGFGVLPTRNAMRTGFACENAIGCYFPFWQDRKNQNPGPSRRGPWKQPGKRFPERLGNVFANTLGLLDRTPTIRFGTGIAFNAGMVNGLYTSGAGMMLTY